LIVVERQYGQFMGTPLEIFWMAVSLSQTGFPFPYQTFFSILTLPCKALSLEPSGQKSASRLAIGFLVL